MRFLFVSLGYHPDLLGGAYRYVSDVAERLAGRGHAVEVIFPSPVPDAPAVETRKGVELHRIPNGTRSFAWNWLSENASARDQLRKARARNGGALTVQCHAFFSRALKQAGGRRVCLFTGPWAEEFQMARRSAERRGFRALLDRGIARVMRRVEGDALRRSDRILTISRYYIECLPLWHGRGLPPATLVSAGVDTEHFRPDENRAEGRRRLGIEPETFLFLAVRRLDPRMGLDSLLETFARVAAGDSRAVLWLAGEGPQREALARRIGALGIEGRVRLLGRVPEADLPGLYQAADCTLMPSIDLEGFGLATIESLACGTPVIGSRAGATPEILGLLDPNLVFGGAKELETKLRAVLDGVAALPDREQCRRFVLERFTWDGPVRAFEAAAEELRNVRAPVGGLA